MNEPFQWNGRYRVDGGVIDAEHQRLFALANAVFAFEDPEAQAEDFRKTVLALFDYTRYHFGNEQALMKKIGYPGYNQQVEAHEAIVTEMSRQIKTCPSLEKPAHKLRRLMVDWVMRHIVEEDRQIAASLEERRLAESAPAEVASDSA